MGPWWAGFAEVASRARGTVRRAKHYRAVARKTKHVAGDVVHAPEETADWVTGETKRTPGWVKFVVVVLILVYPPWLLAHEASNLRVLPGVPFGPSWGDLLGVTVPGVDETEVWEGLRPGEAMPAGWTPSMGQVAEHAKADVCGDDPAAVPAGWPKLPWQDEEPDEGPWLTETFKALGAVMAREMFDPDNLVAYGAWWKDVTSVAVGAAADAFLDADTPSPQVAEYEAAHAAKVDALVPDCDPIVVAAAAPLSPPSAGAGGDVKGKYPNGRIPAAALCPMRTAPGELAQCDAARAFDSLSAAYKERFGTYISVTDSYRPYEAQVRLKASKPHLAAKPGTSNHGWGVAFDLGGGINSFGTVQHEWMRANADGYGFTHPSWARQGGSKPEAWHWEFVGGAPTAMAG